MNIFHVSMLQCFVEMQELPIAKSMQAKHKLVSAGSTTTHLDEKEPLEDLRRCSVAASSSQCVLVPVLPLCWSFALNILFNILQGVYVKVSHPLPLLIYDFHAFCSSAVAVGR